MSNPTVPLSADQCVVFICHWHQAGPGRVINTHLRLRDKPLLQSLYTPSSSLYLSCVLGNRATECMKIERHGWFAESFLGRTHFVRVRERKKFFADISKRQIFQGASLTKPLLSLFFSRNLYHSSLLPSEQLSSVSSNKLDIIWILTTGSKATVPAVSPFADLSPSLSALWRGLPWVPLFQVSLTLAAF